MAVFASIFLLFGTTIFFTSSNAECIKEDSCSCQINEYDKIDISRILDDVKPLTYLNDTIGNFTYTFLGCKDINEYPVPLNKSKQLGPGVLVQSIFNATVPIFNSTVIGTASQIKFSKDEDYYLITFVNGSDKQIQPSIILMCNNFKQPYLKILDVGSQKLLLSSPKVCIITEHHGMGGGSVFILILVIIASIYFIGGGLLLYFIRGARGVETIPNIEFWKNLPGLVKDGVIFILSGCRPNLITTAETYDRI